MDFDRRGILVGFGAAIIILIGLVWVVGVDNVLSTLNMLSLSDIIILLLIALGWLLVWSLALRVVLNILDIPADPIEAFLLFTAATFANNITPFGQAGGEPFSALLISRATEAEYERALAAIASIDTLNFIPSILLAILGLSYYLLVFAVGNQIILILGIVILLAIGVPVIGYFLWTVRNTVENYMVEIIHPFFAFVGRFVPKFTAPSKEDIVHRVDSFFRSIERIADDKPALIEAFGFSTGGWILMIVALWTTLYALGYTVPFAATAIAVPVATIASITPLPGGLGGVELAIVLIIVPITGVSAGTAASAALIFRGATYWFPTILGGGAVTWLEGRLTKPPS
ncbi:MAG: YbhN family protein [Halobacteriaceae archaeon]